MTTPVLYEIAEKLQTPRLKLPIDFTIDFVGVIAGISEFVARLRDARGRRRTRRIQIMNALCDGDDAALLVLCAAVAFAMGVAGGDVTFIVTRELRAVPKHWQRHRAGCIPGAGAFWAVVTLLELKC